MRIAFLLLLGIWLHSASFAQQFFINRLTLNSLSSTLTSVVQRDGKYYSTGVCVDSSNIIPHTNTHYDVYGVKFVIIDSTGNIIKDTFYQEFLTRNLYAFNNSLYSMPDKSFLLAITNDIDSVHFHLMLLRFDSLGNMTQRHEYSKPYCNDRFRYDVMDLKPTGTGEWLILSTVLCPAPAPPFIQSIVLSKLDSNFDIIWQREYGDGSHNYLPGKLVVGTDGYLLACGRNNLNQVGTGFQYRAYFVKTDTSGSQQWETYSDIGKLTEEPQDIIQTRDGGYVYCGSGDGVEISSGGFSDLYFHGWVEKIDRNGHSVWGHAFNLPQFYSNFNVIKETTNGNLIVFGQKYIPNLVDTLDYNTSGWFLALSSAGDSLNERAYFSLNTCNDDNIFHDAKSTTDGGFIMVGESTDYCRGYTEPKQRAWIVKVDSNGCLGPNDPQCQPLNVNQPGLMNNVFVYPNPAHDLLHVRTGAMGGEMQAILSDVSGRELKNKTLRQSTLTDIELKGLPRGLYLLKIVQSSGAVKPYKVSHY